MRLPAISCHLKWFIKWVPWSIPQNRNLRWASITSSPVTLWLNFHGSTTFTKVLHYLQRVYPSKDILGTHQHKLLLHIREVFDEFSEEMVTSRYHFQDSPYGMAVLRRSPSNFKSLKVPCAGLRYHENSTHCTTKRTAVTQSPNGY